MESIVIWNMLKALRGEFSQQKMDLLLSFKNNKYYKIESGYTKLTYHDFLSICHIRNRNLKSIFLKIFSLIEIPDLGQRAVISSLVSTWHLGDESIIYEKLGFSKTKWWRIKNSKTPLYFSDFLLLVEMLTGHSESFLRMVSGIDVKNYLKKDISSEDVIKFLNLYPEFSSILSASHIYKFMECMSDEQRLELLHEATKIPRSKITSMLAEAKAFNIFLSDESKSVPFKIALSHIDLKLNDKLVANIFKRHLYKYEQNPGLKQNIQGTPIIGAISKDSLPQVYLAIDRLKKEIASLISADLPQDKTELIHLAISVESSDL